MRELPDDSGKVCGRRQKHSEYGRNQDSPDENNRCATDAACNFSDHVPLNETFGVGPQRNSVVKLKRQRKFGTVNADMTEQNKMRD